MRHRRKQKENQEDLLRNANENTLKALRAADGGGRQAAGRKVSALTTYARVADMPSSRDLAIQVRAHAWSACFYGVANLNSRRCMRAQHSCKQIIKVSAPTPAAWGAPLLGLLAEAVNPTKWDLAMPAAAGT